MCNNPASCRAAVFERAGEPLLLKQFAVPTPREREALVRVEGCTICGSDLHTMSGRRIEPTPSILGHEVVGEIAALGSPPPTDLEGGELHPGDRVTWSTCVSCSECDRCKNGLPQKCRKLSKYGHSIADGHGALSGGLAEFILLRAGSAIVKLPDSLPLDVACPINCATATVAAAIRKAGPIQHQSVCVFGAGMLGLTATAMAKKQGSNHVVVCDPELRRLELAKQFGADQTVLWPASFETLCATNDGTALSGFDVLLEMSGSEDAVESLFGLAEIGARLVLVGSVKSSRPIPLDPERVVRNWNSIHGVHNYAPQDLKSAVEFISQNHQEFPFAGLVERSFPLEDINAATEYALKNGPIRTAIRPKQPEFHQ